MDLDQIYSLYFKDVFIYVLSLSKNEHVAEEIAQEAFMKALKAIDSYDGSKDIRAWLFTIAKNTYFTYYNKQKTIVDYEALNNNLSVEISFEEQLINEENAFFIHRFLHSMDEPYKEVFSLRIFGELSFEKIGLIFEKSSGWARVTFFRAKKKIIEHMEAKRNEKV